MKTIITMIAACGLLLCSCTKSEPFDGDKTGTVKFTVNAVNSLEARGDINSSGDDGPLPEFATVDVHAFLKTGDDYLFAQTVELVSDYDTTSNSAVRVLEDGTFEAGEYKFIGVGRVAADDYTLTELVAETTNFNDFSASIQAASSATNVIFAGTVTQEVLESGASIEVDISRQVSGIFVYLSNVPTRINETDVAFLRLRVTNANTSVNLGTGEGGDSTGTSYFPIDIDLTTQEIDTVNHVFVGPGDSPGINIVPNSQIASSYAIPINGVTMTMELQDAEGNALKTWVVRDPDAENPTLIDLKPNFLMAIGTKNKADSEYGADDTPDTESPGEDEDTPNEDDAPVSLLTDETITVNVLRNWETVNNLMLEEQT